MTSPFAANKINLKLNTIFGKDEKSGSFLHSFLHIDARDLKFTDMPDGTKQATFDVLAISYGENGVIVDGRLSKIGSELDWDYDWDKPMLPWHVRDPNGQLDVVLTPRFDKHSKLASRKRGSETHQVFGTWSGRVVTDDGVAVEFRELQGFAEEARQEW